jgi:hypothetical protein
MRKVTSFGASDTHANKKLVVIQVSKKRALHDGAVNGTMWAVLQNKQLLGPFASIC